MALSCIIKEVKRDIGRTFFNFFHTPLPSTPTLGGGELLPCRLVYGKTRMVWLPDVWCYVVFHKNSIEYQRVSHGQTDGRTRSLPSKKVFMFSCRQAYVATVHAITIGAVTMWTNDMYIQLVRSCLLVRLKLWLNALCFIGQIVAEFYCINVQCMLFYNLVCWRDCDLCHCAFMML